MMNRENYLLCVLAATGFFACRASNALRFNFQPVDPSRGMNTRQSFPSPSKPCSWAPWQASRGSNRKSPQSNAFEDLEKSSKIQWREEDKPVAAITPPVHVSRRNPNAKAYIKLLRPQNIPSSLGLVAAGALVGSHKISSLFDYKVLLTGLASSSTAAGSCVLNDWFDIRIDRINKPDRPLVTGEVVPGHALAMGTGCLALAVLSASAVHPVTLQATIVASTGLTLAYTPLLKPLPIVKNLVVAGVIGAAITAGGLAAGAGVLVTAVPTALTFFVIAHREILMDIGDMEGDKAAGVRTIPVLLGRRRALALSTLLLTAGVTCAVTGFLTEAMGKAEIMAATLSAVFTFPLYANLARVWSSDFSKKSLLLAVEYAPGPLALVLGLMGFALP